MIVVCLCTLNKCGVHEKLIYHCTFFFQSIDSDVYTVHSVLLNRGNAGFSEISRENAARSALSFRGVGASSQALTLEGAVVISQALRSRKTREMELKNLSQKRIDLQNSDNLIFKSCSKHLKCRTL